MTVKPLKFTRHPRTVVWEDAVALNSEEEFSLLSRPPEIVETYGRVCKTEKYVYVMTHWSSGGESNDFMRIPATLIRKIRRPL